MLRLFTLFRALLKIRDLYVDDTATSFNDLTKAKEFYHLAKSILASGGFNLQNGKRII